MAKTTHVRSVSHIKQRKVKYEEDHRMRTTSISSPNGFVSGSALDVCMLSAEYSHQTLKMHAYQPVKSHRRRGLLSPMVDSDTRLIRE